MRQQRLVTSHDLIRRRHADGVANREFVHPKRQQLLRHRRDGRRRDRALIGAAERGRDIAAHAHTSLARHRHHRLEVLDAAGDRGVDVVLDERLGRAGEDRDLVHAAASARSMPFALGTSAAIAHPGWRSMPAITSVASASCGTARGLTNEVASMTGKPAVLNRSMK